MCRWGRGCARSSTRGYPCPTGPGWPPEDAPASSGGGREAGGGTSRVPAILDFLPYRLGDLMAARDAAIYPYLAARGYACARVDLRGTGNSEGIILDE